MDIRYGASPKDAKRYATEELRDEFLIDSMGLYVPEETHAVYSHIDRMVVIGSLPVHKETSVDGGMDVRKAFGADYFLERREAGFFNLGGPGTITAGGTVYELGRLDCLYITQGVKSVTFKSRDPNNPARFYGVSAPAHRAYETKLLTIKDAAKKPTGSAETANKRVINQFIHPDVLKTCQLSMGLTILEPGSVWNTMPAHTHERRMEVYTYFDMGDGVVFHLMGEPDETRHLVVKPYDAVISPSWSLHAGCGTRSYSFIWAMGGENQAFDDMDVINTSDLR